MKITLTPKQRQALRAIGKPRAPITIADIPRTITIATLKVLSQRGIARITVDLSPEGYDLLDGLLEDERIVHRRREMERSKAIRAGTYKRTPYAPASVLAPKKYVPESIVAPVKESIIRVLTKTELMGGKAAVHRHPLPAE